jgi:fluoride exporter
VKLILIIGVGGFLGAVARYGLALGVDRWTGARFPYGILAVNLVGCLGIGLLAGLVEARVALSSEWRAFLAVGLLGSLTTFSTFGLDTVELALARGGLAPALTNALLHLVLGLGAVLCGRALVLALLVR